MGGWSTPHPNRFTPGKTRYPFYKRLGGPQSQSVRVSGLGSRTVQPAASHYTDCAIPARHIYTGTNFLTNASTCFAASLSAAVLVVLLLNTYRAVNTFRLGYKNQPVLETLSVSVIKKNQPVNAVQGNNRCLF